MTLTWPPMLALLLLIPAGVWLYGEIGRRRARRAGSLAGVGGIVTATGRGARLRTRVPAVLFVLALVAMVVALARPTGTVGLPVEEGTVILAFDVSGSMAATDLAPTRMDAAKAAAIDFVQQQRPGIAIGIVAFSDSGVAVQTPISDKDTVIAAINRLAPQKGTALGQGIAAALKAIAVAEAGPNVDYYTNRSPAPSPSPTPAPVPPGSHGSAVVVLLTDGENNEQPDPLAAAQAAANLGIRIDTVGIGSAAGATLDLNGFHVHSQLNEALLRQVATTTGGTYYAADTAAGLKAIYDSLDPKLVIEAQSIELTAVVAGVSLVLVMLGAAASLVWLGRLP
jgi:Ca-activated chloride channel family protein